MNIFKVIYDKIKNKFDWFKKSVKGQDFSFWYSFISMLISFIVILLWIISIKSCNNYTEATLEQNKLLKAQIVLENEKLKMAVEQNLFG